MPCFLVVTLSFNDDVLFLAYRDKLFVDNIMNCISRLSKLSGLAPNVKRRDVLLCTLVKRVLLIICTFVKKVLLQKLENCLVIFLSFAYFWF